MRRTDTLKVSNLKAPRSLSECTFDPGGDPIDRPQRGLRVSPWAVVIATLVVLATVLLAAGALK